MTERAVQTLNGRAVRIIRTKVEIDREEQKHRSFTGVRGIAEQDAMAQDSQGLIVDRGLGRGARPAGLSLEAVMQESRLLPRQPDRTTYSLIARWIPTRRHRHRIKPPNAIKTELRGSGTLAIPFPTPALKTMLY